MKMYTFTTRWFADSELKQMLPHLLREDEANHILEIGCYEGGSTMYLADVYCKHPHSKLVAVDPYDVADPTNPVKSDTEQRFLANLSLSPEKSKVKVCKQYSDDFFKANTDRFTFIYIDGSHEPAQIVKDAANAYDVLETGGLLWFDDYLGGGGVTHIKNAIDGWITYMNGKIKVIHRGYQLGCVRLA